MSLLTGFRVVQAGPGLAAGVCGRLFADTGATVSIVDPPNDATLTPLRAYLDHGKQLRADALTSADIIITEGGPAALTARRHDTPNLRRQNARAVLVQISPFGQTGARANDAATDLTLFCASFIARILTGQVDDIAEAPIRAAGEQSAFLGGLAAACAGMHAALAATPAGIVDVSLQEVLATLAIGELTRAGTTGRGWARKRKADGNGATVCILPARDGFTAISPREDKQWAAWLAAMGSPDWGTDPRFATKADRVANWDALHALMSGWSRQHDKQWIADAAQTAHVPSFPLREPAEHLRSAQLAHRGYYRNVQIDGATVKAPGPPFGLRLSPAPARTIQPTGALPLSGVRVLDFSWVIAGPTATRTLAAMGADVIKVEAPGRGDPGRASELHGVLGQGKRAIVLDLKQKQAVEIARALAAKSDILIENFATGVMDRLGLGVDALRAVNPGLIYISASGLGRTGPEAKAVAYGTLLQCYAGFAGLNRWADRAPRVGMAWLDPMCAMMLAFSAAAGLWQRARGGGAARIDFSMIEAMLWTMAGPVLAAQTNTPPQPRGNAADEFAPHGVYRCAGDDAWLGIAVQNDAEWHAFCGVVPALAPLGDLFLNGRKAHQAAIDTAITAWLAPRDAYAAEALLRRAGIAAAALAKSTDLVSCPHLAARNFWDARDDGVVPGMPWQISLGRHRGAAPALGEHTDAVLKGVLGLSPDTIAGLRADGVLG